jgi:hypothetical protein
VIREIPLPTIEKPISQAEARRSHSGTMIYTDFPGLDAILEESAVCKTEKFFSHMYVLVFAER